MPDSDMSHPEALLRLTDRQRACLELVAAGFTSKQIARKLGISHSTVDNHVLAATQMLGVPDRREAGRQVVAARQELPRQAGGLINPENSPIVAGQEAFGPPASTGVKFLPPVGGELNDQTLANKTVQILSLALLSTLAVISMALLISGAFRTFS